LPRGHFEPWPALQAFRRLSRIPHALQAFRCFVSSLILVISNTLWAENAGDTTVSYVVCDAGRNIYELEGHAALRVSLPDGTDMAVNYGIFDFNSPGFVYRFTRGETDYMCGAAPWEWFVESYRREGRRVTEHRLALTSSEKKRIVDFLAHNLRPENRVYRYNYVKDNCATRPLEAVERAVADSILLPDPAPELHTFRDVMRHYHRNYPWYQFGIDLALGPGIDYELTAREKAFAPVMLGKQLPGARTASGRRIVEGSVRVIDIPESNAVQGPTPWWASPLAAAIYVFIAATAVTVRDQRRRRVSRGFDAALYGMLGLAGCLVFFLVFCSSHEATSPNYLLAWTNPLCLIPVIFIWTKRTKCLVMCYQIANFAVLLVLCAVWPLLPQSANTAFWPLIAADAMRAANYITLNRPLRHHK